MKKYTFINTYDNNITIVITSDSVSTAIYHLKKTVSNCEDYILEGDKYLVIK